MRMPLHSLGARWRPKVLGGRASMNAAPHLNSGRSFCYKLADVDRETPPMSWAVLK